jgi:Uma2 family endonuclease
MALLTRLTIEDFEKLPQATVKNRELVDGELVDVSGNTGNHNALRDLIISMLLPFIKEHKLGRGLSEQEFDFQGNAHGPDWSFFGTEKVPLYDGLRRVQPFVPDVAIEIVSQHDKFDALMKKARRYRDCGVAEAWIFSIETRQAHLLSSGKNVILDENQEFGSGLIPGFSIRLGDLFDRI